MQAQAFIRGILRSKRCGPTMGDQRSNDGPASRLDNGAFVMLIPLFGCIGFMLAVLYIDLTFDVSAAPYRRTGTTIPKEVLDPITNYYGRITQNPYVLMFVMLTTTLCIVTE